MHLISLHSMRNVMDENLDALNRLKGDLVTIRPISTKLDPDLSDESLLVQMTLYLKVGARVMATKNYVAPGVVNGMTGTVKKNKQDDKQYRKTWIQGNR